MLSQISSSHAPGQSHVRCTFASLASPSRCPYTQHELSHSRLSHVRSSCWMQFSGCKEVESVFADGLARQNLYSMSNKPSYDRRTLY